MYRLSMGLAKWIQYSIGCTHVIKIGSEGQIFGIALGAIPHQKPGLCIKKKRYYFLQMSPHSLNPLYPQHIGCYDLLKIAISKQNQILVRKLFISQKKTPLLLSTQHFSPLLFQLALEYATRYLSYVHYILMLSYLKYITCQGLHVCFRQSNTQEVDKQATLIKKLETSYSSLSTQYQMFSRGAQVMATSTALLES